jgi:hypothetical protein
VNIWGVFVHCRISGYVARYIDSQWASKKKAIERRDELNRLMAEFGVSHHDATLVWLSVADTHLVNEPAEIEAEEDADAAA